MYKTLALTQAVNSTLSRLMRKDKNIILLGEGIDDYKGTFGLTLGLVEKFGRKRVMDMPLSENAFTGIGIGASLCGLKPIIFHQRADFTLLSFDQIINHAAKFRYMFGGQIKTPLTIVAVVGKGWGQGSQHSQCFHSLFAHIPGLKVAMPACPSSAAGILISSIYGDSPSIILINYKLLEQKGKVKTSLCKVPFGKSRLISKGRDCTIIAISDMVTEAEKAKEILTQKGVSVDLIDLQSIKPLDKKTIKESLKRTGRAVIVDTTWHFGGFGQILAGIIAEEFFGYLKSPVKIVSLPDAPVPASPKLEREFYPGYKDIVQQTLSILK